MKTYGIDRKKSVKYSNNKGFTMLEMLFAFAIFLMIASFLPVSINFLFQDWKMEARTQRLEWHVFINQLKKEIRLADAAEISPVSIVLTIDGKSVIYEKYGSNLRRRVDMKGHEVVLQKLDRITFSSINGGVEINVSDSFDQEHSACLYYLMNMEDIDVP
ncbi:MULTISPECIES: competence type IV pilus minor pilin ComGF [Cytobacillus]|jgi:competence protein ComGF|nr:MULTISPECIES: competence type IV pilus minor pilin ComGF [Cytobacillus]MCM3242222.1 prepilin-type N-terminal cleavage/methylation domain-containing protein [Cytobacillus oceanisediminis]MCM3393746.1 prepilin-type N-terminal cleavage/methylation domain-containing protein [Cytobacillus oceanisediminis]MCM3401383.1 prepilin-type N-terminal cleavage/methylation domain-containing protein [Cytobacillus oceanisediminis]MCM3529698.1 prepilin-type N-terminal cleavage/methylation domain-containing pro